MIILCTIAQRLGKTTIKISVGEVIGNEGAVPPLCKSGVHSMVSFER